MKTKLFTLLLALIASVGSMSAQFIIVGDLTFFLHESDLTAEVTLSPVSGDIVIPESVTYKEKVYSVTSIGGMAFSGSTGLTSVTIPNSVTSIGAEAFSGCTSLTTIDIPNSVTSIRERAFSGCTNLTSINIGNNVTIIGNYAFYGCTGLTSVTIPNRVTSIGDGAFKNCTGLTSVTIPNSVISIGDFVFWGCTSLTSVIIPNSVTSIGEGAFLWCTGLTSVAIPNSVISIGDIAFSYCTGLTAIYVDSENPNYCDIDGVLFNKSQTELIEYPAGYSASYIIPNSVTVIGNYAFYGCTSLTSVTIPDSVCRIGDYAFYSCTGLTSIICEAISRPLCGFDVFVYVDCSQIPLYVPAESVEAYKAAYPWKEFNPILPIESSQEAIELIQEEKGDAKILHNGQVFILRGEKVYTLQGQEVR